MHDIEIQEIHGKKKQSINQYSYVMGFLLILVISLTGYYKLFFKKEKLYTPGGAGPKNSASGVASTSTFDQYIFDQFDEL